MGEVEGLDSPRKTYLGNELLLCLSIRIGGGIVEGS